MASANVNVSVSSISQQVAAEFSPCLLIGLALATTTKRLPGCHVVHEQKFDFTFFKTAKFPARNQLRQTRYERAFIVVGKATVREIPN